MRIATDDGLGRVDARWLGVPGWTFPWNPTRYTAYAVGGPMVIAFVYLSVHLFGAGTWSIVYAFVTAIIVTTRMMRLVDEERPAKTLFQVAWAELGAPRGSKHQRPHRTVWAPSKIAFFVVGPAGVLQPLLPPPPAAGGKRRAPTRRKDPALAPAARTTPTERPSVRRHRDDLPTPRNTTATDQLQRVKAGK